MPTEDLLHDALCEGHPRQAHDAAAQLADRSLTAGEMRQLSSAAGAADAHLRMRAVFLLGRLQRHAEQADLLIRKALQDPVWTVRESAAAALAQLAVDCDAKLPDAHEALTNSTLRDRSHFVRDAAVQSLVRLSRRNQVSLDQLRRALRDPRPPIRCRAAEALVCFPDRAD